MTIEAMGDGDKHSGQQEKLRLLRGVALAAGSTAAATSPKSVIDHRPGKLSNLSRFDSAFERKTCATILHVYGFQIILDA